MHQVESEGIEDRIFWIIDEINEGKRDPRVRQLAGKILSKKNADGRWTVQERDWNGEIGAVFNFIRENVRFTRDPHEVEMFQRPVRTLETMIGDCDDLSILGGSILQTIGYPVILRVIGVGSRTFSHIYILVGVPPDDPSQYVPFDASRPEGPGWELRDGVTVKKDFEVTDYNDEG